MYSHGFDSSGRQYDGDGKLTNWWSNSSAQHFDASAACMENQYSQFQILPGVYVNGNQTITENIADNGGVKNAYTAYIDFLARMKEEKNASLRRALLQAAKKPEFVQDFPLFFVSYGQGWYVLVSFSSAVFALMSQWIVVAFDLVGCVGSDVICFVSSRLGAPRRPMPITSCASRPTCTPLLPSV